MIRILAALGIGIAVVGLIATNVALINTPIDTSPLTPAQRTGVKPQAGAAQDAVAPDTGGFAETFERPLFSPTRRKFVPAPVEPKPVEVAAVPTTPPRQPPEATVPVVLPSLLGISISGGSARALLQAEGATAPDWYASGETVDGWTVSAIDRDKAMLIRDGREARLALYPTTPKPSVGGGNLAQ